MIHERYVAPFPGKVMKGKNGKMTLDRPQQEWLKTYFPTVKSITLREMMGVSLYTFYRIVKETKVKKSDEVKSQIWRDASYKGKETCRSNGYYASMKGKAPSPQCIESVKRHWQRVREGKDLHYLKQLQRDDPEQYSAYCKRVGRKRHLLIKDEHFRMLSGMKRNTKLRLSLVHYTKSQCSHRYNALRRGYWVYDDCSERGGERFNIYYDSDTQRSLRFEANLKKDGFNIIDGTNL